MRRKRLMKSRYRLAAASTYSSGLSCVVHSSSHQHDTHTAHAHAHTAHAHAHAHTAHECEQHAQLAVVLVKKKKKKKRKKGSDDEELCHVTWKWSRQVS